MHELRYLVIIYGQFQGQYKLFDCMQQMLRIYFSALTRKELYVD